MIFFGASSAALSACGFLRGNRFYDRQTETIRHLTLLYTNDEHGWMDPYKETSGAVGMMDLWKRNDHLAEKDRLLILSGGDMWTGPALSTATGGEAMADIMNAMGYAAAALGNHDFDFGLENLRARAGQSAFPFLSANLRDKDSGAIPDFVQPYAIRQVNGVNVGIIGLTTRETAVDTQPASVSNLSFLDYEAALLEAAAQARDQGAELLILVSHLCVGETRRLAPLAAQLGIPLIGGGHCHEEINELVNGVRLIESGYFLRGYTQVDLLFDTETRAVLDHQAQFHFNEGNRRDAQIGVQVEAWRERLDPGLSEVLGYTDLTIQKDSEWMAGLVLEPWIDAVDGVEIALTSPRYLQQDIFPGEITLGTLTGVLAVPNELVVIDLNREELIQTVKARRPLIAGLREREDGTLVQPDGIPIAGDRSYRVIVPQMIYGGANYYLLYKSDPTPTLTGIDWRVPVIDRLRTMDSSKERPLPELLQNR